MSSRPARDEHMISCVVIIRCVCPAGPPPPYRRGGLSPSILLRPDCNPFVADPAGRPGVKVHQPPPPDRPSSKSTGPRRTISARTPSRPRIHTARPPPTPSRARGARRRPRRERRRAVHVHHPPRRRTTSAAREGSSGAPPQAFHCYFCWCLVGWASSITGVPSASDAGKTTSSGHGDPKPRDRRTSRAQPTSPPLRAPPSPGA